MNKFLIKLAKYLKRNNMHNEVVALYKSASLSQNQIEKLLELMTHEDEITRNSAAGLIGSYSDDYETVHDVNEAFKKSKYYLDFLNYIIKEVIHKFDGNESSISDIGKDFYYYSTLSKSIEGIEDQVDFFYYVLFSELDSLITFVKSYGLKLFVNASYNLDVEKNIANDIIEKAKKSFNSINYELEIIESKAEYRDACCEDDEAEDSESYEEDSESYDVDSEGYEIIKEEGEEEEEDDGLDCSKYIICDEVEDYGIIRDDTIKHKKVYYFDQELYESIGDLIEDLEGTDADNLVDSSGASGLSFHTDGPYTEQGYYISTRCEYFEGAESYNAYNMDDGMCLGNQERFTEYSEYVSIDKEYVDVFGNQIDLKFNDFEIEKIKKRYGVD